MAPNYGNGTPMALPASAVSRERRAGKEEAKRMSDQHPSPTLTLEDVKSLAAQLDVTFTDNGHSFDLDKQEPFALEGTYCKEQAGIDAAYTSLVRYQANLDTIP